LRLTSAERHLSLRERYLQPLSLSATHQSVQQRHSLSRPSWFDVCTGILRKSSGFGVFAEIFSKNIVIPSKEIPFFGEAPKRFWAIVAKFGLLRMTRLTEYSVIRMT
jgi:hypothetical protein